MAAHAKANEGVREAAIAYDAAATKGDAPPIYHFGEGVLEGEDLKLSDSEIHVPGFEHPVTLELDNPYADMTGV